jgi:hypothetical protein
MGVPRTDAEGRRWFSVFNTSKEPIPPFGCLWASGKRFGGPYTEKKLPTDGEPSWSDLQYAVGRGNLCLASRKPFIGFTWGTFAEAGFYFNGPTEIPPKSWGRCTSDYPTIARIRSGTKHGRRTLNVGEIGYYYRPLKGSYDLVSASVEDRSFGYGWSWGWGWGGFGWGNRFGYGQPPMFWVQDIVKGFDETEGLAWVTPSRPPQSASGFQIKTIIADIEEGENDVQLVAYDRTSGQYNETSGSYDVANDAPWLSLKSPGVYDLRLYAGLYGSGGEAPGGENPYSQLEMEVIPDPAYTGLHVLGRSARKTLAPPVIKQGSYSLPSTYLEQFDEVAMRLTIVVDHPEDYDPLDEPTTLGRIKMNVHRTTNAPDNMNVTFEAWGIMQSEGVDPLGSSGNPASNTANIP